MNGKQWYVELDLDEEPICYESCKGWTDAFLKMVEHLKKGIPFTCKVDFTYRGRGDE